VRVALADDSTLFRDGLSLLLAAAGIDVVAQARSGAELLSRLAGTAVDVVVLDLRMPPTFTDEGLVTAEEVHARYPSVGVLVLSTYAETAYAVRLLSAVPFAVGYLLKDRVDDVATLAGALSRIRQGETVVDPMIVRRLMERRRVVDPLESLSPREREVLILMAEGRSNAGISHELHLGAKTVEGHIATIFRRLDLHAGPADNRRVLAVLTWLRSAGETSPT